MDRADERDHITAHDTPHIATTAALMARIRTGDEAALTELMRLLTPRLLRIAMALLHHYELAVEVTQDAFIALWEQRTTLRDDAAVSGFLTRVVRNRALNVRRSDRRYHNVLDATAREMTATPAVAENTAEQAMDAAERSRMVWQMVGFIPEQPRRVLILRWFAELSYPEIATMLGVKVKTVHQLMYRATAKLAEQYRGMSPREPE